MKDHEFREAVNSLRDMAQKYGQTEQLRARCHEWLKDLLATQTAAGDPVAMQARMPGCRWENYHKDDKAELIAAGMEIRWLYAAPPAVANGDETKC